MISSYILWSFSFSIFSSFFLSSAHWPSCILWRLDWLLDDWESIGMELWVWLGKIFISLSRTWLILCLAARL